MKEDLGFNRGRPSNAFQSSQETESLKDIMAWESLKCDLGTHLDDRKLNEWCGDISNNMNDVDYQFVFNDSNVLEGFDALTNASADQESSFHDKMYSSVTWSPDFDYTNSGCQCEDVTRSWSEHEMKDNSLSETSAHRVKFVPVQKYDIHIYPSAESEDSRSSSPSTEITNMKTDGQERSPKSKKKLKFNANNNFIKEDARNYMKVKRWSDENVYNRTEVLAQPKSFPKGFKEDRRSVYWISKKPPKPPMGGKTMSIATPRVEELAKPLYDKGKWKGHRHCTWKEYGKRVQSSKLDPSEVDWSRLAAPKLKMEPQFNDLLQPVSSPALKFQATKRIIKLAQPKKKIDCNDYYLWLWNRKPKNQEMLKKVKKLTIDKTDLVDARVLLRCDLDYKSGKPIEEKIAKIVPTIHWAFKKKARAVIIVSHCGNPNGQKDDSCSLQVLQKPLEEALGMMVVFLDDCIGAEAIALSEDPEPGYIFLLENIGFHPQELGYKIKEDGNKESCTTAEMVTFRSTLYNEGDVYINDAFTLLDSDCTSNVGPSDKDKAIGYSIKREMAFFNYFCVTPGSGLVVVIGGTFVEVADIVTNFMGKAREILLGGPIANNFIQTLMDVEFGEVNTTEAEKKKIRKMMVRARDTNSVINLPSDLVVQNIKSPGVYYTGYTKDGLDDYYEPVDIGPLTRCCYREVMEKAEKIVWIGMMGELPDGTSAIACGFAQACNNGTMTYLVDDKTASIFFKFCPKGRVTQVTENSEVTMMFLHRKVPKGMSTLSPYRKKIKKRPPKEPFVSNKPTSYGSACMRLDNALDRLSIEQLDLKNKTVIIRAIFNVDLTESNTLENNYCLRMIIPNIKYALQSEAFAVVLLGSMGEQDSPRTKTLSLRPLAKELARLLNLQVKFLPEVSFSRVKTILKESFTGTVLVVENVNIRFEEHAFRTPIEFQTLERVEKVTSFCQEFSSIGDVYVNDAFGSLHENTATTSGCLLRHRACGFLQKSELRYLSATFLNPPRPFLIILGGKRGKLKYEALHSIMCEVDQMIITGSLAFGFLKLVQNVKVGKSIYDPKLDDEVLNILAMAKEHDVKLYFPVDFVITDNISKGGSVRQVSASTGVPDDWFAVDLGDKSCSLFRQIIKRSKLILWQGVSGVTEIPKFTWGTSTMLEAVMTATQDKEHKAVSIISGMSMCAFLDHNNPDHVGISHVTTGGLAVFSLIKDRSMPSLRRLSAVQKKRALNRLCIDQVDIKDMAIFVRTNFNLPVDDQGEIQHPHFLKDLVATIKFLQRKGAKSITLVGHYGKPKGNVEEQLSLIPARRALERFLKQDITFLEDEISDSVVSVIKSAEGGKLFMLENIRFHQAEEGWEMGRVNVPIKIPYQKIFDFRNILGKMCDIYVNEDLNSLSYCDSCVVGVPAQFKTVGLLLKNELAKFRVFLDKMSTPFLAIVGGHNHFQLASKLEMTFDLLDSVTHLMFCGDIAWHVLKYMKGNSVKLGSTPIDTNVLKYIPRIIHKASINNIMIYLPTDFHINELKEAERVEPVAPSESGEVEDEEESEVKYVPVVGTVKKGLTGDQKALDIGPETLSNYQEIIKTAKSIVLLGPAGDFTQNDYRYGSQGILSAIEEAREEDGAASLAFGYDTSMMLRILDAVEKVDHVSMGTEACVDLIRGALLPGLESLSPSPPKPLKKLSVDRFVLADMRVLLRLDLDIPVVEGVVLDKTKLDRSMPTIKFLLNNGVKSVIILGHRGRPRGFKNDYLTLKPLAEEFSQMLQTDVMFLEEPCCVETRALLEDPPQGSVFLMENLKFYPAEAGRDAPRPKPPEEEVPEEEGEIEDQAEEPSIVTEESEKKEGEESEPIETGEETETGAEETEETEATSELMKDDVEMIQEATDPENIDMPMYQLMSPKTVQEYIEEITECGDVFVNDDVMDIETKLTSMTGFACRKKMCGLLLKDFIATYDTADVYEMLGVASLTKGPREGEMDKL